MELRKNTRDTGNRRRHHFTQHPIQRKYLRFILLAMCLPTILVTACLYYLIWQTVAYELAIPELIAETLFPALARVNLILLIGLPFVCAGILFFAFRITHRLAGPLSRIERMLDDMIRSRNFSKEIRVRKGDDLESLVRKINEAVCEASRHSMRNHPR